MQEVEWSRRYLVPGLPGTWSSQSFSPIRQTDLAGAVLASELLVFHNDTTRRLQCSLSSSLTTQTIITHILCNQIIFVLYYFTRYVSRHPYSKALLSFT